MIFGYLYNIYIEVTGRDFTTRISTTANRVPLVSDPGSTNLEAAPTL
jgi:hypothetical protein